MASCSKQPAARQTMPPPKLYLESITQALKLMSGHVALFCMRWSQQDFLLMTITFLIYFRKFGNFLHRSLHLTLRSGRFTIPSYISDDLKDLIKRILVVNSVERMTVEEIW